MQNSPKNTEKINKNFFIFLLTRELHNSLVFALVKEKNGDGVYETVIMIKCRAENNPLD